LIVTAEPEVEHPLQVVLGQRADHRPLHGDSGQMVWGITLKKLWRDGRGGSAE
jgi:hypothetical protein